MAAGRLGAQGTLGTSGRGSLGENHPAMSSGRIGAIVLATLACVCSSVDVWVLMTMALPLMDSLNPAATTIQAVAAAAGYALVALVALKAPRLVSPIVFGVVSVVMIITGSFAWWWGMDSSNAVVATVGVCMAHFGCSWPRILVGASLCALGNKRDLVLAAF